MAEPHVAEMGRADARSERAAGGGAGLPAARGARRANPERDAAWEEEEEGEYGHGKRAALVARRPSMAGRLANSRRLPRRLPRRGERKMGCGICCCLEKAGACFWARRRNAHVRSSHLWAMMGLAMG
jgi:hypothetical protein